jgi:hypothetical protein
MEYHIDRKVILSQDSDHKSLYKWSLQEVDANGKKLGRDLIPWAWSFNFRASELSLSDILSFETKYKDGSREKAVVSEDRRFIFARLTPERGNGQFRETTFSMFGTRRTISRFDLHIEKIENENGRERCETWGCVSYTAETDFRNETSDDFLVFMMYVSPRRFAAYAEKISSSAVDDVILRVTGVSGFYSDWSPSISTGHVKVLTGNGEHEVAIPKNCTINPPRLGDVTEAKLYFQRLCKLGKKTPDIAEENKDSDNDVEKHVAPVIGVGHVQAIEGVNVVVTRAVRLYACEMGFRKRVHFQSPLARGLRAAHLARLCAVPCKQQAFQGRLK